jgi:DNA-directed RNA polymerase subunit H (RpoH/RPB5)
MAVSRYMAEFNQSFVIYTNAIKLLDYRGYKLKYSDLMGNKTEPLTLQEFKIRIETSKLIILVGTSKPDTNDLYIIIVSDKIGENKTKISESTWNAIKSLPKGIDLIFVNKYLKSQQQKKIEKNIPAVSYLQIVGYKSLIHKWVNHNSIPKHSILTPDEIDVLKSIHININKLPKISSNENVLIWIGAKIGDVVKIEDTGEIANTSYRIVI